MVHEVWGQKDHPSGLDRIPVKILALSFHITGHHAPSRTSYHPKTRQENFTPFCCNDIYLSKVHHLFKNDPDRCSI
jgi:hypothetical protein